MISFIQDDPQNKTELVNGEEKIRDDVMINERHTKVADSFDQFSLKSLNSFFAYFTSERGLENTGKCLLIC